MLYTVFHFKSLKIVLGQKDDNTFVGYSVDTKYPEYYSRPLIRGTQKQIVELIHYLYTQRLMTAYNCEGYEWSSIVDYSNDQFDTCVRDWVHYVLNTYIFYTFGIQFDYKYMEECYEDCFGNQLVDYYLADDLDITPVSYWEPIPRRRKNAAAGRY